MGEMEVRFGFNFRMFDFPKEWSIALYFSKDDDELYIGGNFLFFTFIVGRLYLSKKEVV